MNIVMICHNVSTQSVTQECTKHTRKVVECGFEAACYYTPGMRPNSLWTRIVSWNERIPLLVIGAWAVLYLSRPLTLGFYCDDWWSFVKSIQTEGRFSPSLWAAFLGSRGLFASRPITGALAFLVSSISGLSPFRYQVWCAVLALGAALSLRAWLSRLISSDHPRRFFAADLATLFWLSAPWDLAATAWPSCAVLALPGQIFFTEAGRRLAVGRKFSGRDLLVFGLLLTASVLSYETFYLAIFPVAAYAFIFHRGAFRDRRGIFALLTVAAMAHVVAIAVNRYIALMNPSGSKKFEPRWYAAFASSLWRLPQYLIQPLAGSARIWIAAFLVLGCGAAVLAVRGVAAPTRRILSEHVTGLLLVSGGILFLTTLVYSLAGYGYTPVGLESRTMLGAVFALSIAFFCLISASLTEKRLRYGAVPLAAAALLLCMQARAQTTVLADWRHSWEQEQQVLARVPAEALKQLPPDSRVLFIGPGYYHGMVIFGVDWDLAGALYAVPALSGRRIVPIHPATEMYNWNWDGATLARHCPGAFTRTYASRHLFVWNDADGSVREAKPGYTRMAAE